MQLQPYVRTEKLWKSGDEVSAGEWYWNWKLSGVRVDSLADPNETLLLFGNEFGSDGKMFASFCDWSARKVGETNYRKYVEISEKMPDPVLEDEPLTSNPPSHDAPPSYDPRVVAFSKAVKLLGSTTAKAKSDFGVPYSIEHQGSGSEWLSWVYELDQGAKITFEVKISTGRITSVCCGFSASQQSGFKPQAGETLDAVLAANGDWKPTSMERSSQWPFIFTNDNQKVWPIRLLGKSPSGKSAAVLVIATEQPWSETRDVNTSTNKITTSFKLNSNFDWRSTQVSQIKVGAFGGPDQYAGNIDVSSRWFVAIPR